MYLGDRIEEGVAERKSKSGKVHTYKTKKTFRQLKCDCCGKEFERDKGDMSPKRCNNDYKHFCEDCKGEAAREGQKSRRKNLDKMIGDVVIDASGYPSIYVGLDYPYSEHYGGRVREHVYVMEQHLGRCLKKVGQSRMTADSEVIHHIDGDKLNNKLENLDLCTVQEHNSCHARMEYLVFQLYRKGLVGYDSETQTYFFKDEIKNLMV